MDDRRPLAETCQEVAHEPGPLATDATLADGASTPAPPPAESRRAGSRAADGAGPPAGACGARGATPETLADGEPAHDPAHVATTDSTSAPAAATLGDNTAADERTSADLTVAAALAPSQPVQIVPAIPGYEIEGEIGRGGMGVVYRARALRLNRPCAIKMILSGAHASPQARLRFLAEAEAVAKLHHPNVVQIYHIGEADGLPFLELEYIAGGSLAAAVAGIPWQPRRAAALVELLARAVAAAHDLDLIHRDLKPGNVLLASDGTPKIIDFGLAKALGSESGLTATDSVLGSPSYMAPEQAAGAAKTSGPSADVYSLGAILYELLTGRPPFRGATVLETLEQVRHTEPVAPSRLVAGLPRDVETIALKCLEKDPAKRYETAAALADDLHRFGAGLEIHARPVSSAERTWRWCRRNPVVASLSASAVLLLLLVAAVATAGYARTAAALGRESAARKEATAALYHSFLSEASTLRTARAEGYRAVAFDRLRRAAALATPDRDLGQIRREAIACLGDFVGLEPLRIQGLERRDAQNRRTPFISALAPDSRFVAVGFFDGSMEVYDAHNGARVDRQPAPGQPARVSVLAYSSSGKALFAGDDQGLVRRFDIESASGRLRPAGDRRLAAWIAAIVTAPDARTLVATWDGKKALVHDLARDDALELVDPDHPFRLNKSSVRRFALSPRGRYAATITYEPDGAEAVELVLWDLSTTPSPRPVGRMPTHFYSLAFDPSTTRLAIGGDEQFSILEVPSLKPVTATGLDSATALAFSPDGRSLAVGTINRALHLWGEPNHREAATLRLPGSTAVFSASFSADGRLLAAATAESLCLWDLAGTHERLRLAGHDRGVPALAFSPDGMLLASVSKDHAVRLWDPVTGGLIRAFEYPGGVQGCRFSPDGSLLAVGSDDDGSIRVWETKSWTVIHSSQSPGPRAIISALEFSRDGSLLAASGDALRLWKVVRAGGGRVALEKVRDQPTPRGLCVAISHDGRYAASTKNSTTVEVRDIERGTIVPFSGPEMMLGWHGLAFRSARELVYIARTGTADVWDVASGQKVRSVGKPGTFQSFHIAVSPDGRWLAAEATPSSVAIADLERGEVVFTLHPERSQIWSLVWSADAKRVAVGLADGGVSVWDLEVINRLLQDVGLDHKG
jgi:eukaryotic-like serine/threonine-protein kinase